ncbi:MAG: protein kinase [Gemmatimonadaceae bacterium]
MDAASIADRLAAGLAGRYRIERELGRGGMATVYLAHDLRHDRKVALKVLLPEFAVQSTAERFLREIRVVAGMSHPQILPLLDSGRLDVAAGDSAGEPWFAMPFVAGESLRAKLDRERQLGVDETMAIATEVAEALDFAHARGVIHRDIKPENILLFEGHAMVADFGIARALGSETERMTATGMIVGTPMYMSPEQASSDQTIDGRADQYALACMVYEMLAGMPPFAGPTVQSLIARHAIDTAPPVRTVRPEIAPAVDGALRRAMSKAPPDRYATTLGFAHALRGKGASGGHERRRRNVAAVVAVLAIAGFAVAYRQWHTASSDAQPANRTRVAVLPLRSVSPNPADQYFADGMTDELTSTLAGIGELKVMARASVAAYSDPNRFTMADMVKQLDVGSIVSGSVRKDADHLRITIELSDGRTGENRWRHTYDKTLTDVFAIQRDVAMAVASALQVALLAREATQMDKRPAAAAPYEAYLRARVLLRDLTVSGAPQRVDTAITLLRMSVRMDSTFAPAWASLSVAYSAKIFSGNAPPAYRDSASAATDRALSLDPSLSIAYRARANLEYTREGGWKITESLRDNLRAVALKPSGADERATFGSLLFHIGLLPEAGREFQATLAVDPANNFVKLRVPRVLWQQQRFKEALEIYQRDRALGWVTSVYEEALVLGYLGRAPEGLALLRGGTTGDTLTGDNEATRGVLLARLGRNEEARSYLKIAEQKGGGRSHFHHASFAIATAHALMGEKAEAVRWLERTAREGMPAYSLFADDPALATLKGTPEYESFMKKLKVECDEYRRIYTAGS